MNVAAKTDQDKRSGHSQNETWKTLCLHTSAFLVLKGHRPKLFKENGKILVGFDSSDELFESLTSYSAGEKVSASQLSQIFKHLKSRVFAMRDENESGNGGRNYGHTNGKSF